MGGVPRGGRTEECILTRDALKTFTGHVRLGSEPPRAYGDISCYMSASSPCPSGC